MTCWFFRRMTDSSSLSKDLNSPLASFPLLIIWISLSDETRSTSYRNVFAGGEIYTGGERYRDKYKKRNMEIYTGEDVWKYIGQSIWRYVPEERYKEEERHGNIYIGVKIKIYLQEESYGGLYNTTLGMYCCA
jgi:hypothetical protein